MKLPPFILAVAILFWGWQSAHEWLALFLAILFEASRMAGKSVGQNAGGITRLQKTFSPWALGRISNGCALIFIGVSAYFLLGADLTQSVLSIIRWSPLVLLPLMLAIQFSGLPQIRFSTISSLARWQNRNNPAESAQIEMGVPYVCMWLLGAGVSNQPGPGFYLGLFAISAWMLWDIRPRHGSLWLWLGLLLCAGAVGALINQGLYRLQGVVEQRMIDLMSGDSDEDPTRTSTQLGHIGQLKLSGAVVLQVKTNKPLLQPLLLKTARYNLYSAPSWLAAGNQTFQTLRRRNAAAFVWHLPGAESAFPFMSEPVAGPDLNIEIATTAVRMNSVLALPMGARGLESTQFIRVERNPLGTVQAALEKGFYLYRVNGTNAPQTDSPTVQDLTVPRGERALLESIVQRLALTGESSAQPSSQPTTQTLGRLKAYFAANYRYSIARGGNAPGKSAMADFLTRDRRGHCEHFATASVLLLRTAGIPARYIVGYSVQEPNRFGTGYVVRQRHAHAWTEAYVDGAWQTLDTTPPVWGQLEQSTATFWEPLADAVSGLFFQVRQWQITRTQALLAGITLLAIILLRPYWQEWRTGRKLKKPGAKSIRKNKVTANQTKAEPQEPAFYQIETLLAARGLKRPAHESLHRWQARIAPQLGPEAGAALAQIIHLHYRCRFGPLPVPQDERLRLQAAGRDWIAQFG